MKPLILIGSIMLLLSACATPGNKKVVADTSITTDSKAITVKSVSKYTGSNSFLSLSGRNNVDTTRISLQISNDKVAGDMTWLPYQKDKRAGKLSGNLNGDAIKAVWTFMQEGMTDTLNLKFKLIGNQLLQKPLKLNTKTGRDQTDDAAGFTIRFAPTISH